MTASQRLKTLKAANADHAADIRKVHQAKVSKTRWKQLMAHITRGKRKNVTLRFVDIFNFVVKEVFVVNRHLEFVNSPGKFDINGFRTISYMEFYKKGFKEHEVKFILSVLKEHGIIDRIPTKGLSDWGNHITILRIRLNPSVLYDLMCTASLNCPVAPDGVIVVPLSEEKVEAAAAKARTKSADAGEENTCKNPDFQDDSKPEKVTKPDETSVSSLILIAIVLRISALQVLISLRDLYLPILLNQGCRPFQLNELEDPGLRPGGLDLIWLGRRIPEYWMDWKPSIPEMFDPTTKESLPVSEPLGRLSISSK
jgi:hypothetical protein